MCLFVRLPVLKSVHVSVCLSVFCLFVYLYSFLFICLFVCISFKFLPISVLFNKTKSSPADQSSNIRGLLHIGYNEIQLLNTDHVTVIRTWPIKNIKACAQVRATMFCAFFPFQMIQFSLIFRVNVTFVYISIPNE